ncbi:STAS domain-containing protein [Streptomyces sp. G35A]
MTFLPKPPDSRDLSERVLLPLPSEIDYSNASEVRTQILSAARTRPGGLPRVLVLDLSANAFMDSQGVRLINEVRGSLHPHTRVFVVARPDGVASRVLGLTGLRRDVPVYDNLLEAMAA